MASVKVLYVPFEELLQPWLDDVIAPLDERCEVELRDPARPFCEQVQGARVVVDQGGWGTRPMLDAASSAHVALWQVLGTGLDHFDVDHALDCGLRVANTPGTFSAPALAEHALLLMLCFAKNLDESRANIRSGRFYRPLNEDLHGKTLAIVGFGASGRALAVRAACFEMRLLAIDLVRIEESVKREYRLAFGGGPGELDHVLAQADYVSLHIPLDRATERLLDARRLALLKPSAVLVNVARGGLVDAEALATALTEGRIRGAGLDVFDEEPIDSRHPLLRLENVVATPHIAGGTRGTSRRRGAAVADNIIRVLEGKPILNEVRREEERLS
jgi:phosphoglycerate dehydrogenase-like enzyme